MIAEQFEAIGVIPVITLQNASDAEPLGEALVAGGLPCAEITLRTETAIEGLRRLSKRKNILVGAGTVLSIKQAEQAKAAGAAFIVSPGLNPAVVRWAIDQDMPVFPGVSTATEIETALNLGLTWLKFFPAEAAGGLKLIQALSKPYHMVRFMPTGGINPDNLASYLSDPAVFACGGSWMVKGDWIRTGDFDTIQAESAKAAQMISSIRSQNETGN